MKRAVAIALGIELLWVFGPAWVDTKTGSGGAGNARRRRIVREALRVNGLSVATDRDAFIAALGLPPAGMAWGPMVSLPYMPDGTGGISTCALVARNILRRAGIKIASLEQPYRVGSGYSDVLEHARTRGALREPGSGYVVRPGDSVIVDVGAHRWAHVGTVVTVQGDDVTTVDGGLRSPDGLQAIGTRKRSAMGLSANALIVDVDRL